MSSYHQLNTSDRLIFAVSAGRLEIVRNLINFYGLSYSKAWSGGYTLLLGATKMNRTAVAKLLLKKGSLVNSNDDKPADTPLHFAALHGDIDIVKMLLNKGANVNAKNKDGKTPLFKAIDVVDIDKEHKDKLKIIELLLKHKADVNVIDNYGTSPLHIAVKSRCLKIVEFLSEYGVNVNCVMYAEKWNKNHAPLHYAAEYDLKEVTTLLLSRGANVDVKAKNGVTPLHIAAERGYVHIAEDLLKHGACIHSLTLIEGYTPLHFACKGCKGQPDTYEGSNFEETVKVFLNKGADVNASTKDNLTPLYIATKGRNAAIVKLLLQCGAKVDNEDKDGKTILHLAVEKGDLTIVEDLLKHCPDVNNPSNRRSLKTAVCDYKKEKIAQALLQYGLHLNYNYNDLNNAKLLHAAIRRGYVKIVEDLLKYGTDVNMVYNTTHEEGFTPLHTAIKCKQDVIAKLLISYEADINAQDKSGKTPIFYAIQNADLKMTKLLLTNKAIVKDNPELLNLAVKKDCLEIIEALLQYDADINYSDKYGRTALHFTTLMEDEFVLKNLRKCSFSNERLDTKGKIAKLLLSMGANVNSQTKSGITTICAAVKKGFMKVVEALLEYNAKLNSPVKTDVLPLHLSAQIGNEDIIRMLLNKGADVNAKQSNGTTSLHIAVEERRNEVVKILLDSGADINFRNDCGRTALHIAILKGCHQLTEILLKYNSDVNAQDDYGRTALHLASKAGDEYLVQILLNYGSDINVLSRNNHTAFHHAIALQQSKLRSRMGSFHDDYDEFNIDPEVYQLEEVDEMPNFYEIWDDDFDSDPLACEILGVHVLKMKTANLYVNEQNLLLLNSVADKIYFDSESAEEEIEKMKSEKIHNANVSFYDILARDASSLANYMRNDNVVQILKLDDYKSKFPIYAGVIKCYFRKVMKRKELLDQVNEIIYFLFNNLPELPDDCTGKILSYLSDADLKIIMDACK